VLFSYSLVVGRTESGKIWNYNPPSEVEEGRIKLDSPISAGGSNLSIGQCQILALVQAIVRGSKVLILDEATSVIYYKTDTVIQASLRNELDRGVTLIIVAHRLQTIIKLWCLMLCI